MPVYHQQEEVSASFSSSSSVGIEYHVDSREQLEPGGFISPRSPKFTVNNNDLEPSGSAYSSHSIRAKPTGATLAESFSNGSTHEFRQDQKGGVHPDYYANPTGVEYADSETQAYTEYDNETQGYTEYDNETQEAGYTEYDNETQGYTANDDAYYEERQDHHADAQTYSSHSAKPYHSAKSGEMHNRDGAYWEETSMGYETCASRTINTNLEGMNYLEPSVMMQEQQYHTGGDYEEHYDEEQFYDAALESADHTTASSTNRHSVGTAVSKKANRRAIDDEDSSSENSEPIDSYGSEDSGSSWEERSARDVSLLDSADSQDDFETFDDDDESSDDGSRSHRRRRGPRPTMLQMLKNMKNCTLKGATASYEDSAFEFLPDVAQISEAISSRTSMTGMTEKSRDDSKSTRRRRKEKKADTLFSQLSVLGEGLLADHRASKKKQRGKSSRRRDRDDPTATIIDSLRNVFSCGAPRNY